MVTGFRKETTTGGMPGTGHARPTRVRFGLGRTMTESFFTTDTGTGTVAGVNTNIIGTVAATAIFAITTTAITRPEKWHQNLKLNSKNERAVLVDGIAAMTGWPCA